MAHVENNVENTQNENVEKLLTAFYTAHENAEKIPYIVKYTENNKTLQLRKKTITKLVELYGIEKEMLKNYYSYKNNHAQFNAVLALLENRTDIFTPVVD